MPMAAPPPGRAPQLKACSARKPKSWTGKRKENTTGRQHKRIGTLRNRTGEEGCHSPRVIGLMRKGHQTMPMAAPPPGRAPQLKEAKKKLDRKAIRLAGSTKGLERCATGLGRRLGLQTEGCRVAGRQRCPEAEEWLWHAASSLRTTTALVNHMRARRLPMSGQRRLGPSRIGDRDLRPQTPL